MLTFLFVSKFWGVAFAEDEAVVIRLGGEVIKADQAAQVVESKASEISIDVESAARYII